MGGLWKLAAMSAVIGAGLVVVWQAQQSLSDSAAVAGDAGSPDDSPTLGTPTDATRDEDAATAPTPLVANASVPPEGTPPATTPPKKPATNPPGAVRLKGAGQPAGVVQLPASAKYKRDQKGLDFNRAPELQVPSAQDFPVLTVPQATAPAAAPQRLATTEASPLAPATNDTPLEPAFGIEHPIDLTAGTDEPAAEEAFDPFGDPNPPAMSTGTTPDVEPEAAEAFDPFMEAGTAPPPVGGAPAELPDLDAAADPFTTNPPAPLSTGTNPEGEPATIAPAPGRRAAPAPLDPAESDFPGLEPAEADPLMNAAPGLLPESAPPRDSAPRLPSRAPAPTSSDPVLPDSAPFESDPLDDPFDGAAPPPMPNPARSGRSTPPALEPDRGTVPPPREPIPAPTSRVPPPVEPTEPLFQGDGEVTKQTPRGVQEPRLTIEKLAPPTATLGQPVVYSVVIKNVGGSPATNVVVEDRIPKGSRLVGTAPQAEMVEKRLVWRKIGTLQPGEERKISIKVIPEEEGPIGSVAKVSFIAEVAAEIEVRAPKLKLMVNVPDEAKVGEAVPLVFTIANTGNGQAGNVVVRSILPEGLQHPAGSDLEYSIGTLAPQETREVRLEVTALKPGRVEPQTIVTADGNLTTEGKAGLEIIGEQLLLERHGHDRVYVGRNIVFTNQVTNEGSRAVKEVTVTEVIPEGFEFVEVTGDGRYDRAKRTVTWTLPGLSPGASDGVTLTLKAKSIGQYDSVVKAVGPTGSTATVKPTIMIEGFPTLALERLCEDHLVGIGEQVTTRIALQNRGTAPAKNVGFTIDLPAELKLVSVEGATRYRVEGRQLVFEAIEELAPRATTEIEFVFETQAAGDGRLEMRLTADHLSRPLKRDETVQVIADAP